MSQSIILQTLLLETEYALSDLSASVALPKLSELTASSGSLSTKMNHKAIGGTAHRDHHKTGHSLLLSLIP